MFNKFRKTFILAVGIASFGLFQSVNADWTVNDNGTKGAKQDIVISLQSNPMSDPERACLAVTFARSLSNDLTSVDPEDHVYKANVTLFVTLDGVTLADDSVVSNARFKCDTPWGEISLQENLDMFLAQGNNVGEANQNHMVVCPICWKSRYGNELPDYGVLPGTTVPVTAIGQMIFRAEKILDF